MPDFCCSRALPGASLPPQATSPPCSRVPRPRLWPCRRPSPANPTDELPPVSSFSPLFPSPSFSNVSPFLVCFLICQETNEARPCCHGRRLPEPPCVSSPSLPFVLPDRIASARLLSPRLPVLASHPRASSLLRSDERSCRRPFRQFQDASAAHVGRALNRLSSWMPGARGLVPP